MLDYLQNIRHLSPEMQNEGGMSVCCLVHLLQAVIACWLCTHDVLVQITINTVHKPTLNGRGGVVGGQKVVNRELLWLVIPSTHSVTSGILADRPFSSTSWRFALG
jgi:hypothetical protein